MRCFQTMPFLTCLPNTEGLYLLPANSHARGSGVHGSSSAPRRAAGISQPGQRCSEVSDYPGWMFLSTCASTLWRIIINN